MNVDDVRFLFEYDRWANSRVFEAVSTLTEEQFTNVRETLAHIAGVEWIWLQRVNGINPTATPDWVDNPTRDSLRAHLGQIEAEWRSFVDALTDADLPRPIEYVRLAGERGTRQLIHLLQHVVNHSTYHRGQVATRMRQAGGTPLETDFLHFTA
jgi:uncharacterized damage-inducible protein DinB